RVLQYVEYLINAGITITLGAAVFGWWLPNRKRIAAETDGRAEARAPSIGKEAERDAETGKKGGRLEAKEKAAEGLRDAERQAHQRSSSCPKGFSAALPSTRSSRRCRSSICRATI